MSDPRQLEILSLAELADRYGATESRTPLAIFARKEWEKYTTEINDLDTQLSWAYQFIAGRLGLHLDHDDVALLILNLAPEDAPENKAVRTVFGVGQGHTQPDSKEAALLDVMKVLALCFELSMRAGQALSYAMQAEATLATLKDQQR